LPISPSNNHQNGRRRPERQRHRPASIPDHEGQSPYFSGGHGRFKARGRWACNSVPIIRDRAPIYT
jgi:hypothetical protein